MWGVDNETRVSHVIPSVELKGSRAEKLQTLDTLIRHLMTLRRRLSGDPTQIVENRERVSDRITAPAWPWFVSGAAVSGLFVLLAPAARSCG